VSIKVQLKHKTHYRFDRAVVASPHEIRLRPALHSRTPVSGYALEILPKNHFIHWQQDAFGNFVARVTFPEPVREMFIGVELIADMTVINPFDFFVEDWAEFFPFAYPADNQKELAPYLECDAEGPQFEAFLKDIKAQIPETITTTNLLVMLNQKVQARIRYMIRLEPGVQSPEQTLTLGSGSCRDSAWLLAQLLRHLGIATRFVSGYLIQLVADQLPLEGPEGPSEDFTDLHAWCEAYVPGAGWVGMDATSGLLAGEGHIPLAVSSLPTAAAPVIGLTSVCQAELDFSMGITRIHEDPRVTLPYSDSQWSSIMALGDKVESDLKAGDVRLTQGGEPTFVSADNMDGPEWNTDALGEEKWTKANELMERLRNRFAPGGLFHYGQGKWYPGEPLPRWAMNIFWREDGTPLWHNLELLRPKPSTQNPPDVFAFAKLLAECLALHPGYLIAAYEDPWHALDAESRYPENIDPHEHPLEDLASRNALAKAIRKGLGEVVGYVLPLKPVSDKRRWRSSLWPLRQERLYLIPGDSPMGLRLPLASLPWVLPEEMEPDFERDPFEPREALEKPTPGSEKPEPVKAIEDPREVVHTALVLEVRDGLLHVFLPPLSQLEDFVGLIAVIESVAEKAQQPIRLEGYSPPRDPRLKMLSVTPDPGVIEVNIHPSEDWQTLVSRTRQLYEDARQTRLIAEKFMLDGRHTGTGGGNHITLGGAAAAESPFLRRPDLLVSLIRFWQRHPALSYLFSGQFIGPTSQAPRVDEARDDNLYELEIAFQQLESHCDIGEETPKPWLVDRLLRNLLIDMTGNTHRSEFCIDKLYSPDSATGRLGILELRAFEMPPHYQMSLVQALLLRCLIARFWRTPERRPLVYWDTALHDRFMLPHFIESDLREVISELRLSGYDFDENWLEPFMEFRFPRHGTIAVDGIELSLRQAIEPWHVLGEEVSGGGTARYVDSSVERLEIRVDGLLSHRHDVLCNGRMIPLHPTGTPGQFVAGVRFKAWSPPSSLHPTIGVQAPLVFDVYDKLEGISLGGCTYHVCHPGGRNYDTFPVNAQEAEARRRARFWEHGHVQGKRMVADEPRNHRFPTTLDLRWEPSNRRLPE
jgi:uncharacterized protein (DUF2126 family)/transglutaminase-like putative cysteine protease